MKAAIVLKAGSTPVYGEFKEPIPASGKTVLLSRLPRSVL